jgi:hypothetical protein
MYLAARLAFCPNTYKPPSSNDEMTSNNSESWNRWTDLCRALSIAAHDAGNPTVSNGSQQSIRRETKNWSLVNDRKSNRVNRKHLPK